MVTPTRSSQKEQSASLQAALTGPSTLKKEEAVRAGRRCHRHPREGERRRDGYDQGKLYANEVANRYSEQETS